MEENADNQELLRVTVNSNSSLFVKDNLEHYAIQINDSLRMVKEPGSICTLSGFSDSHTAKKAIIFYGPSDCIKVAQFY